MDALTAKRRAALGVIFLILRTAASQLCILGGTVILARVLDPADFGVYAILQFALTFFQFFGDAGIGGALIRRKEPPSERELASVFWLQILLALAVVVVIWSIAPVTTLIWKALPPASPWLLRAMSIAFLLTAARIVPSILLERSISFGAIAIIEVLQTVAFYVVACVLALRGAGIWSWAWAMVLQAFIGAAGCFLLKPWRPRLALDWSLLRPLIAFGIPYQVKGLIGFANGAVAPLYAGAALGPSPLGFINWGQQTAYFPLKLVEVMSRVSFPLFARFQDDPRQLARSIERSLQVCALGTFFCIGLFLSMGPNITTVVFTPKWIPGLFALYAYSLVLGVGFLSPVIGAALDAIGRPGIIARLAIGWTALNWAVVPVSTHLWGTRGFVLGNCVHILVGNLAVVWVARKAFPGLRFLAPMAPPVAGAVLVFLLGWFWTRSWAWSPLMLSLAVALLFAVQILAQAALDPTSIRDTIQAFKPKRQSPASP